MSSHILEDESGPTAWRLFFIFSRIGLTSFGGGLSGWLMREFVRDRSWMNEEEFLNGLALAQSLPGVNVTNMAIWIGYRLAGARGAIAGVCGIVVPPAILIVLMAVAFSWLSAYPLSNVALAGAAAAAIGLSGSLAITAARRAPRRVLPMAVLAATFVAVGLLQWPLVWVALGGGLLSVAVEYHRLGRGEGA